MKKINTFLLALILTAIAVGCSFGPQNEKNIPAGMGSVYLSIAGSEKRTIFPDNMETLDYSATFSAVGKTNVTAPISYNGTDVTLEVGTWNILIEAKSGSTVVGTASVNGVSIANGQTTNVTNVRIIPVASGTGTVNWSVQFPNDVNDAKLYYDNDSETNEVTIDLLPIAIAAADNMMSATGAINLASGSWFFRSVMKNTVIGAQAGKSEALHVYSGLDTTLDWKFTRITYVVDTIEINEGDINNEFNIGIGDVKQLTVTIVPIAGEDASDITVKWSSTDPEIVSVTEDGYIIAHSAGEADIIALASDGSGKAAVLTVKVTAVLVTSVTIQDGNITFHLLNQEYAPSIIVLPENATDRSLEWSSDNTAIATVDEDGVITSIGVGTTNVTVTAADGSGEFATVQVKVEDRTPLHWNFANPLVTGWTDYDTNGNVQMSTAVNNYNQQHTTVRMNLTANNRSVRYYPVKGLDAPVAEAGFSVGAVQTGGTSGTAASGSNSSFMNLASVPRPFKLIVYYSGTGSDTGGRRLMINTGSGDIYGDPTPDNPPPTTALQPVVFEYSMAGTGTVTIRFGCDAAIRVYDVFLIFGDPIPVNKIVINEGNISIPTGNTRQLSTEVFPANAGNKTVTWSSSSTGIATVSNGLVTAVSTGTATITAAAADGSGKSDTVQVTVTAPKPVEDITIVDGDISLIMGRTRVLTAFVLPDDAKEKNVTWSSDNTAVATVNSVNGLVTPVSVGTAVITASAKDASGKSDSITVTVMPNTGAAMTPQEIFEAFRGQRAITNGWADMFNNGAGVSYTNPTSLTLIDDATYPNPVNKRTAFTNALALDVPTFIIVSGNIDLSDGKVTDSNHSFFDQFDPVTHKRVNNDINFFIGKETTIIGIHNARVMFGGLVVKNGKENIIIRNLTFWDAHGSTEFDTQSAGNADSKASATAFQIENSPGGSGIWVDHCRFTDGTCNDLTRNYNHDGGFDIKFGRYITCSWTEFTNHDKVMLVGSNDSAYLVPTERQVTLHHNYFHGVTQRLPRSRGTQMHIYNNYYNQIGVSGNSGYMMGPGMNSHFIVESNNFGTGTIISYFDNSTYPARVWDNGLNNKTFTTKGSGKPWEPAYIYTLEPNAGLPTSVPAGAGTTLVFTK